MRIEIELYCAKCDEMYYYHEEDVENGMFTYAGPKCGNKVGLITEWVD